MKYIVEIRSTVCIELGEEGKEQAALDMALDYGSVSFQGQPVEFEAIIIEVVDE